MHFSVLLLLSLLTASAADDAVSLLAFKANADSDNKLLYTTTSDVCQWRGVECAQGRVVRYDVEGFGLRGSVSGGTLSRLDQLQVLSLRNNSLFGAVPDLSPLVNLHTLFLDQNSFTGAFPPSLLSLRRLVLLDLSRNDFSGPLPEELAGLAWLSYLRVDSNRFSGAIPALNQTALAVLNVSNNSLSGPVPATATPSPPHIRWVLRLVVLMCFTGLVLIPSCCMSWERRIRRGSANSELLYLLGKTNPSW